MQTNTQNTDTQVSVIMNSIDVLKTGPEILQSNQIRKDKALAVGQSILEAVEQGGMTAELDERANNYLVNINKATKQMKEDRSAVTQIMDQLKKMYTEVENELDPKKDNTIPNRVQKERDAYSRKVAAEAEEKRKEAERVANKAREAVDLKYQYETHIKGQYGSFLLGKKNKILQTFNAITLESFDEKSAGLKGLKIQFQFQPEGSFVTKRLYHTDDELKAITDAVVDECTAEMEANYNTEMELLKQDLIDKLPSKLAELQEQKRLADEAAAAEQAAKEAEEKRQAAIARANAEEKERLEKEAEVQRQKEAEKQAELKKQQEAAAAEQQRREDEEKERLAKEAEESAARAQQEADVKKQGEEAMVMFEQEAAAALDKPAPETRNGYEIEVLHPVGFTQIFALWFEKEGKNLPIDKIGNTKLDQMKAWAEKMAHKDGTKIDSKFLKYNETFKAVNRKAK